MKSILMVVVAFAGCSADQSVLDETEQALTPVTCSRTTGSPLCLGKAAYTFANPPTNSLYCNPGDTSTSPQCFAVPLNTCAGTPATLCGGLRAETHCRNSTNYCWETNEGPAPVYAPICGCSKYPN